MITVMGMIAYLKNQPSTISSFVDILKEGAKDDDIMAVKLAKKWHTACMDTGK